MAHPVRMCTGLNWIGKNRKMNKTILVAILAVISGSMVSVTANASVVCKYNTRNRVPYVSVSTGKTYERIDFANYRDRDAALSHCVDLAKEQCSSVTVRVSNYDGDGEGQKYSTYHEAERYTHSGAFRRWDQLEECESNLAGHISDEIAESFNGIRN